jgi:hypothetical protein
MSAGENHLPEAFGGQNVERLVHESPWRLAVVDVMVNT